MFKIGQAFDCTEERKPYDLFILTIVEFDDARFALDVHAKEAVEDGVAIWLFYFLHSILASILA